MTREEQFNTFWSCYPRRISKGAARKAFDKAIKKATLETMLKAITDYVAKKPEKIDFKHPATWLNGECWDDEWEPPQSRAPAQTFRTSADRFQSPEEYRAYYAAKNRAEEGRNPDMLARLKQAGVAV